MTQQYTAIHGATHLSKVGSDGAYGGLTGFNYNNEGGWLQITTNDANAAGAQVTIGTTPYTFLGFGFVDHSGGGIVIGSDSSGNTSLITDANMFLTILPPPSGPAGIMVIGGAGTGGSTLSLQDFDGGITITQAGTNPILIQNTGNGGIDLVSYGAGVAVLTDFPIILSASGGTTEATVQVIVSTGNYFLVSDQTPNPRVLMDASGKVAMFSLPTSSAGLASGYLWNSAGTVKIV